MNREAVSEFDIEVLQNGYYQEDDAYCCVWCQAQYMKQSDIKAHIKEKHSASDCFYEMLNADSLLDYSYSEKAILMAMYEGKNPEVLADKLQIKPATIRSIRRNLFVRYHRTKLEYLVLQNSFQQRPKRKYTKMQKDKSTMLVTIDSNQNITGQYTKAEVHNPLSYKYHPTVIILPFVKTANGLEILVANKNHKVNRHTLSQDEGEEAYWDVCGGHVESQDLRPGQTRLDEEVFRCCAKRELMEELVLKEKQLETIDLCGPLIIEEYGPASMPDKTINHELSAVFGYLLDSVSGVKIQDDYIDTLGNHVTRSFTTRLIPLGKLLWQYQTRPQNFMDGLGRVCQYFLKQKLKPGQLL